MLALVTDLLRRREVVFDLAKNDFRREYAGSVLGFAWAFIQPLMFIAVLYVVFTVGLRANPAGAGMPFVVYLTIGMICWMYFATNLAAITGVFLSYSFLINKVNFRLSVLPLVKLLSSLPTHLVLICVAVGVAWQEGFAPTLYTLQLFYYFLCLLCLLYGVGLAASAANLFVRDVQRGVAVVVQFGFWATPVFWNPAILPERFEFLVRLNPVWYLVRGYRDSIVNQVGFWERPVDALVFWATVGLFWLVAMVVYRRLKPHFAEVVA